MKRGPPLNVTLAFISGTLAERLPPPNTSGWLRVADNGALLFESGHTAVSFSVRGVPTFASQEALVVAHHDLGSLSGSLQWTGRGLGRHRVCSLEVGLISTQPAGCARFDYWAGSDRDARPYEKVSEVFAFARHLATRRAEVGLHPVELASITNAGGWLDYLVRGDEAESGRSRTE